MNAKGTMNTRAIQTNKDTIGNTSPLWIGRSTIKASLVFACSLNIVQLLFVLCSRHSIRMEKKRKKGSEMEKNG
jgi:hypothetical protein